MEEQATNQKQQKIATVLVLAVVVVLMGVIVVNSRSQPQETNVPTESISGVTDQPSALQTSAPISEDGIVIYYGITCPYCKDVDEWIEQEAAEEWLEIEQKEVYEVRANANELTQVAASCGHDTSRGVGVPFMYANGECYLGKIEIIDYLEQQLNSAKAESEEGEVEDLGEVEENYDEMEEKI